MMYDKDNLKIFMKLIGDTFTKKEFEDFFENKNILKVGDFVRIEKCLYGHEFKLGEICKVVGYGNSSIPYICEKDGEKWHLSKKEIRKVDENIFDILEKHGAELVSDKYATSYSIETIFGLLDISFDKQNFKGVSEKYRIIMKFRNSFNSEHIIFRYFGDDPYFDYISKMWVIKTFVKKEALNILDKRLTILGEILEKEG